MPNTHTDTNGQHGWGWLHRSEPTALQPVSDATDGPDIDGNEWQWLNQPPSAPLPSGSSRTRVPRRVWIGLGAALGLAAVLVGVGISSVADHPDTVPAIPTLTAGPPTTTQPLGGACTGLAGQTVTDTAGDTHSLTGVIAAFEHAYYVKRDAEAALRLVAPEAGLAPEALAAGIASIPAGTTHCVAITPIADGVADVHVVQRHPDGQRVDYLQLINVRHDGVGVVITNIQKRG
ncbi:hypothetical protein IU450_28190 [Nocardia abscessus]|uniref:hypothetical protein n=1 Tax=Nocardia abscessus TaxID=120957 RepID=UPI001893B04C|nr:hypothetical protein [Nocardia abscessus]MBF6339739.1 hypothetical protein [Nocardia abscessus]